MAMTLKICFRLYQDEVSITIYRTSNTQLPEDNLPDTEDTHKDMVKSKSTSWLRKMITTRKKGSKSTENFQQNYYLSNLGYKVLQ